MDNFLADAKAAASCVPLAEGPWLSPRSVLLSAIPFPPSASGVAEALGAAVGSAAATADIIAVYSGNPASGLVDAVSLLAHDLQPAESGRVVSTIERLWDWSSEKSENLGPDGVLLHSRLQQERSRIDGDVDTDGLGRRLDTAWEEAGGCLEPHLGDLHSCLAFISTAVHSPDLMRICACENASAQPPTPGAGHSRLTQHSTQNQDARCSMQLSQILESSRHQRHSACAVRGTPTTSFSKRRDDSLPAEVADSRTPDASIETVTLSSESCSS